MKKLFPGLFLLSAIVTGNAQFSLPVELATVDPQFEDIAAVDFDGDNDLDLLITNGETFLFEAYHLTAPPKADMFAININNGDGTFTTVDLPSLSEPSFFAFGDISGDGYQDFVYADVHDIYYRENLGDHTFGPQVLVYSFPLFPPFEETDPGYDPNEVLYSLMRLQVGDVDSDGNNEVVIMADGRVYSTDPVSNQYGNIYTSHFNGTGFDAPEFVMQGVFFFANVNAYEVMDLQVSDFNLDGLNDIYYTRNEGLGLDHVTHYAVAAGLFDETGIFLSNNFSMTMEDMNLDAVPEMVSSYGADTFGWFNISGYNPDFQVETTSPHATGIAAISVNDDDLKDVVLVDVSGIVYAYPQVGEWQTFQDWQYFPAYYTYNLQISEQVREIISFDYEEDGTHDIVLIAEGKIYVLPVTLSEVAQPTVEIQFYIDEDEDSVFDTDEDLYGSSSLVITNEDDESISYFSFSGQYSWMLDPGTYTLAPNDNSIYFDPSGVYPLTFEVTENDTVIHIPFVNQSAVVNDLEVTMSPAYGICNGNDVTHLLFIWNTGNTEADGTITYTLNEAQDFISSNLTPAGVNGNVITWNYEDLPPMSLVSISLVVTAADISFLGDQVTDELTATINDPVNNVLFTVTEDHTGTILCAYDPNDITEFNGYTDEGYVFAGDALEYVVRFQNTGNAPAQDVRIENQLPEGTDWNSLQPRTWSHDFTLEVDENGLAVFQFNSIMLPDDETDEPGSHGYIVYTIQTLGELDAGDMINNTAEIYFDFNPAIVTNTEVNTIYHCADLMQVSEGATEVCTGDEITFSNDASWIEEISWSIDNVQVGSGAVLSHSITANGELEMTVSNALCSYSGSWELTAIPMQVYYSDADGDGYGNPGISVLSCVAPAGHTLNNTDCNDNNAGVRPGAVEVCGNSVDDDCDGLVDEGCTGVANDNFSNGVLVTNSGNAYPSCGVITGSVNGATISNEGNPLNVVTGEDVWYRFVATSTACRIAATPSGFNVVLELRTSANVQLSMENVNGNGGIEILNYSGLVPGQTYYVGVRNYNSALGSGSFSLCTQQLVASYSADGSGTYDLCSNMKVKWTGANSYTLNFVPVSPTPGTATSGTTTSQLALSTSALALRHGGVYQLTVNALYNLTDGAGNLESILVQGVIVSTITIAPHANVEVKPQQRCAYPATLMLTTSLQGKPFVCSAKGFTVEFTRVTDCSGQTSIGSSFTKNTNSASANLSLNFSSPQALTTQSWYSVRWRPNFDYGPGTYGQPQVIYIGGTSIQQQNQEQNGQALFNNGSPELNVFPNPNNGEAFGIELDKLQSESINITVIDSWGRILFSRQFPVQGSLRTNLVVERKLAAGLYFVEVSDGMTMYSSRMVVLSQ